MKVLVACECSGVVRDAFLARGHDATSCDLLPTRSPGPHIKCDVRQLDLSVFELVIAHPPCRYLSFAGAAHWDKPGRAEMRAAALDFFLWLYDAPVPRVCVENPVGYPNRVFRRPDQIIHPYLFGDAARKRSCLWLRGLPPLMFTYIMPPPAPVYVDASGKRRHLVDSLPPGPDRAYLRSRSFAGIAGAMAAQWG